MNLLKLVRRGALGIAMTDADARFIAAADARIAELTALLAVPTLIAEQMVHHRMEMVSLQLERGEAKARLDAAELGRRLRALRASAVAPSRERDRDASPPAAAAPDRRVQDHATSPAYPFVLHEFVRKQDGQRRRLAEQRVGFIDDGLAFLQSAWTPLQRLGSGAYGSAVEVSWAGGDEALVARQLPTRYVLKLELLIDSRFHAAIGSARVPAHLTESGVYALLEALRANSPLTYGSVMRHRDWCRVMMSREDMVAFKVKADKFADRIKDTTRRYAFQLEGMKLPVQVLLLDRARTHAHDHIETAISVGSRWLVISTVTSILTQVIVQLYYLNRQTRAFRHRDLHLGNVLVMQRGPAEPQSISYDLPGCRLVLHGEPSRYCISDFGRASVVFYVRHGADSFGEQTIASADQGTDDTSDAFYLVMKITKLLELHYTDVADWFPLLYDLVDTLATLSPTTYNWADAYGDLLATHPFFEDVREKGTAPAVRSAFVEYVTLPSDAVAAVAVAPIASERDR